MDAMIFYQYWNRTNICTEARSELRMYRYRGPVAVCQTEYSISQRISVCALTIYTVNGGFYYA